MKNNQNPDHLPNNMEQLRIDNEVKKIKLNLEYGADFGETQNKLPLDIEGKFLDYVLNFEKAFKHAKRISVFDKLGKPEYRKTEEISNEEIGIALDHLLQLLNDQNICVDTLCDVDDRELYRFITEELFTEEIDDMTIPGMISHYIYEEFHPNHEYDIKNHSADFFKIYLDFTSDFYKSFLSKEASEAIWHTEFRASFNSFILDYFNITGLTFDSEKARVQFDCDFTGVIENSTETVRYQGKGEMGLAYQWDYWCIDTLKLPQG